MTGLWFTLEITLVGVTGGIVFGSLLAVARLSQNRLLSGFATAYVNLMRSIPLILVIFWVFFLVPWAIGWLTNPRPPGRGRRVADHLCHVRTVRGGLLRRDRARRLSFDLGGAIFGLRGAGPLQVSRLCLHPVPASDPQRAADPADPDHHPVSGHLAGLCHLGDGPARRRHENRRSATAG